MNNKRISASVIKIFSILGVFLLLTGNISLAQKGMPAKSIVTASVTTNYAQHEDFKESMLSRLVVPSGYKISIAATGLGKPRMLQSTADGSRYVTRRDQGEVLLLSDTDKDGRFDELEPVVVQFKGVHGNRKSIHGERGPVSTAFDLRYARW